MSAVERAEIEIIREFLPRQLDDAEVEKAIADAVEATQAESLRDMGKVMAWLKERYNGQIDFSKVGAIVRERLK